MSPKPCFTFFLWLILWVAQAWLMPRYFERMLHLGAYPVNADSIAIPIAGTYGLVFFGGPFVGLFVWWVVWKPLTESPGWTGWCRDRWGWSLCWSVIFGFFVFETVQSFFDYILSGLALNALADIGWLYVHLSLRAIVIARFCEKRSPPAASAAAEPDERTDLY